MMYRRHFWGLNHGFRLLTPCKTCYKTSDTKFKVLHDRGIWNCLKSRPCGVMTSFVAENDDFRAFSADVKLRKY